MKISEINIYPIKSLGGISLNEAIVEKRGFQNDRRFMLTDKNGDFFTQREFPKMAMLSIEINANSLNISDSENRKIEVPFEFEKSKCKKSAFGKVFVMRLFCLKKSTNGSAMF